mmetsp:Transcript_74117/g.197612  ORF Transcript_74117/g.197612 Transcript_74117/m.197612 type:complete len:177 (+) Transcript_74117:217-747(+)
MVLLRGGRTGGKTGGWAGVGRNWHWSIQQETQAGVKRDAENCVPKRAAQSLHSTAKPNHQPILRGHHGEAAILAAKTTTPAVSHVERGVDSRPRANRAAGHNRRAPSPNLDSAPPPGPPHARSLPAAETTCCVELITVHEHPAPHGSAFIRPWTGGERVHGHWLQVNWQPFWCIEN